MLDYLKDPDEIYRLSFETVRREAKLARFDAGEAEVAVRLIHACGMPEIADDLRFASGAVKAACSALADGAPVICDCEMVAAAIIRGRLPAKNPVLCHLNDPVVRDRARGESTTRSAAQVSNWLDHLEGSVVAIGNAPTALFRLLEEIAAGAPRPAAILGFPVGFVGAAESKGALVANQPELPYATLLGRRGGSPIAAAAVNAISGLEASK